MDSTRWVMPSVFESTTSTPMDDIALLGIFSEYMVNMMTQTPGIVFFRIEAVSTPFMFGIDKSKRTTSAFNCLAFSMASAPRLLHRKSQFQGGLLRSCE